MQKPRVLQNTPKGVPTSDNTAFVREASSAILAVRRQQMKKTAVWVAEG
jgi:hypothetical protein